MRKRWSERKAPGSGTRARSYFLMIISAAIFLMSCGDAEPTVADYSAQVEQAVTAMNTQIDSVDIRLEAASSTDEVLSLWDERLLARETFLSTIENVEPPAEVEELRAAAVDILTRLVAAEAALREVGAGYTMAEFSGIWDSPEGQAARAVDAEAVAICQAVESDLSQDGGTEFGVAAWLRPELKEVVEVVFGCLAEDRPTAP